MRLLDQARGGLCVGVHAFATRSAKRDSSSADGCAAASAGVNRRGGTGKVGQPACQRNSLPHQRPRALAPWPTPWRLPAPLPCACAGRGGGVPLCDGEPRRKTVHCFVLWLGLRHGVPAHRGGCGCKAPVNVPPCMLAAGTQGGRTVPGCTAFTTSVPAMLCRAALWRDSRTWCSSRRACCGEREDGQRVRGSSEGHEVRQAAVALDLVPARSPPPLLPLLPVSPCSARWWCARRAAQPCDGGTPAFPLRLLVCRRGSSEGMSEDGELALLYFVVRLSTGLACIQCTPACMLASWADAAARVVLRPPPTPPFRCCCCCCCCCCSSLLGCIHAHCFDPTVSAAMPAHFPPRQVPVAPGKSPLMSLPLATNKKFR